MHTMRFAWGGLLAASGLAVAACGSTSGTQPSGVQPSATAQSTGAQTTASAGKDLANFDPCSVVSDSEYVQAIVAGAGDPSALGTITATHAPVDGAATGLPGAKACAQSYTTVDSAGRQSQGGAPVIVTFDLYSNLAELQGTSPITVNDYTSAGAQAFEGPGDGGDPHITKDGYLFRMSGNSDLKLLKAVALGIASRL